MKKYGHDIENDDFYVRVVPAAPAAPEARAVEVTRVVPSMHAEDRVDHLV